jgi:hypothetical protein
MMKSELPWSSHFPTAPSAVKPLTCEPFLLGGGKNFIPKPSQPTIIQNSCLLFRVQICCWEATAQPEVIFLMWNFQARPMENALNAPLLTAITSGVSRDGGAIKWKPEFCHTVWRKDTLSLPDKWRNKFYCTKTLKYWCVCFFYSTKTKKTRNMYMITRVVE